MNFFVDLGNNSAFFIEEQKVIQQHFLLLEQKLQSNNLDWPPEIVAQIKILSLENLSKIVKLVIDWDYSLSLLLMFALTLRNQEYYKFWADNYRSLPTVWRAFPLIFLHAQGLEGLQFLLKQQNTEPAKKIFILNEIFFQTLIDYEVAHSQNISDTDNKLAQFFLSFQDHHKYALELLPSAVLHELPHTISVLKKRRNTLTSKSAVDIKYAVFKEYLEFFSNLSSYLNTCCDRFYHVIDCYKNFKTKAHYRKNLEEMIITYLLFYTKHQHDLHYLKHVYPYFINISQKYHMRNLYDHIVAALMAKSAFDLRQLSRVMDVLYYQILLTYDSKKFYAFQQLQKYESFLTRACERIPRLPFVVTPYFLNMALKNKAKVISCYESQLKNQQFSNMSLICYNSKQYSHLSGNPILCLLSPESLSSLKKWHTELMKASCTLENPIVALLQKTANEYESQSEIDGYSLEIFQMNITVLADLLLSNDDRRQIAEKSRSDLHPEKKECAVLIDLYQAGLLSWVRKHVIQRMKSPLLEIVQKHIELYFFNQQPIGNIAVYHDHAELKNIFAKYEATSRNIFPLLYSTNNHLTNKACRTQLK